MVKCECGALNPEEAKYCQDCGNNLNTASQPIGLFRLLIIFCVIIAVIGFILRIFGL
jgi:hypothetical protein